MIFLAFEIIYGYTEFVYYFEKRLNSVERISNVTIYDNVREHYEHYSAAGFTQNEGRIFQKNGTSRRLRG
jgi:hypothetical protein